jgi:chromosome partitioning protein
VHSNGLDQSAEERVRTIAVINRKGGSGKTTTAVNTAAAIAEIRPPVLLIDLDPQGSASEWLARRGDDWGLGEALERTFDLTRLAVPTDVPGLEIVPTSEWLVTAERSIQGKLSLGISRAIRRLPRRWSTVIVDCPPSLSYLTIGVLMGVQELIIPVEAHAMALSGADAIIAELPSIKALNPDLRTTHMLPCRVNRTLHARTVVDRLATAYPTMITQARIRETIRLPEAADARQPVTRFAPVSIASDDYRAFARELLGPEAGRAGTGAENGSWWRSLVPRPVRAAR